MVCVIFLQAETPASREVSHRFGLGYVCGFHGETGGFWSDAVSATVGHHEELVAVFHSGPASAAPRKPLAHCPGEGGTAIP